jgi:alpha-galactosidase/6-phospho-beta-glucosidase family protein
VSFKIAVIGAGSVEFTRTLVQDLLSVDELRDGEIALMDIDPDNLRMIRALIERDLAANGLSAKGLTATTDRRTALRDARYVLNTTRIGGLDAFQMDIDIPLRYGVDQCVGDTICAGGIMYGQRTIPFVLELCNDIRETAEPGARLLNYANPMAMNTWAANAYGGVETIGLCHGVQHGHAQIAEALGVPKEELDIVCAGINHQTWYVHVRRHGVELTQRLLEAFEKHPRFCREEKVRIDVLRRFGYYSTESNGHLSEYLPWYRKRTDEIVEWIDTGAWYHGETGGYLRYSRENRDWFETAFRQLDREPPRIYDRAHRSIEHGSYIIEALETGRIYRGHFNVVNRGCISNLPDDAVVEVPGYVDANGVGIPRVGDLPLGPAAVCAASISVQRLAVEAAVRGDDLLLRQAMLMDPLTGAVCNPPEIWQMVDEMLVAQKAWLPQYAQAIAKAAERLERGASVSTRNYAGTARRTIGAPSALRDRPSGGE